MPTIPLTDVELDAILAALGEPVPEGELPAPGSIASLALGAGLFAGLHLLLSSGWLRPRLVRALGESNFTWLYTIVAIATLTWAWYAWEAAPYVELWPALPWTRWIPNLGMPLVCILVVCGYTTDSPTIAGKGESLGKEGLASGVLRITRHPANVGFTLWGLLHLPPNGDLATVLLISPVLILGIFGIWHIERRRQARHGEAWTAYARETSIVPFAAILRGAQHLSLREIGWARTLGGLAVWAGLLLTHHLFVGVLPYPNL